MYRNTLSALIGLVGAVGSNGKTADTDAVVRQALLHINETDPVALIHKEKYRIAPDCASCPTPCGNTSDYPMEQYEMWTEGQRQLKEQVIRALQRIAADRESPLPEIVYQSISYLGCDLEEDTYHRLLEEMQTW